MAGNTRVNLFADPMEAARGAHLVTTDVWTSMGYEEENAARMKAFADWRVDDEMMAIADKMPYSCTVCRRIGARKLRRASLTARNRLFGKRRKTACKCKRH